MAYMQATLLINGALEFDYDIPCEHFDNFFTNLEAETIAEGDDELVELYVINHEHEELDGEECYCVQYLTDHHPFWTNKQEA